MIRPRSLKQSLAVSHILVSLVPLAFIALFMLLFLIRSISEDSMVKIGMLAQGTRGQIQLFMDQPLNILRNLSGMISVTGEDDAVQRIFDAHIANATYFEAIYQIDHDGRIINAGLPRARSHYREELLGMQLGHKPEFVQALASGVPQWSDTFLSLSSGRISLTLYSPEKDFMLAADINLNALAQLINRLSRDNVVTMVIDRNGAIIFHPDPSLVGKSIMVNTIDIVTSALQGKESSGEFTFDGKKYIGSTSIIAPAGWVSLIAEPIELQQTRMAVPLLIFAGGLAGAAVLSMLLAVVRSRSLSHPLTEITKKSSVIAGGNYSTALPKSNLTELEELAESIRHMAASIQQRENQLRINERKYRELVENTSNLVLRLDHQLAIVYANHTLPHLSGKTTDLTERPSLSQFMAAEDYSALRASIDSLVEEKRSTETLETRLLHSNGCFSNLLLSLHLHYNGTGKLDDVSIIGHDITSRLEMEQQQREMEKQQQQSQKMELLGLMASGVAHDLNNILAGIINYPELLLLKMEQDDPNRNVIESIKKSGERAAAVVADLLTIARHSASVHEIVSIGDLIKEYCASPDFKKVSEIHPGVTFSLEQQQGLWSCRCSKSHIEKTLINLIVNGFEAVKGEGTVAVVTNNITLAENSLPSEDLPPGAYVAIHIVDSGEGIDQADIKRIFDPFFSRKGLGRSGTGLGLTVAWSCVREHRGSITVTSSPGGTHFTVYLPATPEQPVSAAVHFDPSALRGNRERILVVDDEEALREIATNMLLNLNYRVQAVSSGEEALQLLERQEFDLVLLDMQMDPGMSGRETFERINAFRPHQRALVASGYSDTRDVDGVLSQGAGAFIRKPYSMAELGSAVKEVLQQS